MRWEYQQYPCSLLSAPLNHCLVISAHSEHSVAIFGGNGPHDVLAMPGVAACFVVKVHDWVVIYIQESPIVCREEERSVLGLPHAVDVTVVFASLDAMGVPAEPHSLCGPGSPFSRFETVRFVFLTSHVEVLLLVGPRARPDILAVEAPIERLHERSDLIMRVPEGLVRPILLNGIDPDSVVVRTNRKELVTRRIAHHFAPLLRLRQSGDRLRVEICKAFNDNFTVIITDGDVVEGLVVGYGS